MKKFFLLSSFLFLMMPQMVLAQSDTVGTGKIEFNDHQQVADPENPVNPIEPEDLIPPSSDLLRLDYVPSLKFSTQKSDANDQKYAANAMMFADDTMPRAQFIQVTDRRGTKAGWNVSVRQEKQFATAENIELDGAMLSFDYSWTNGSDKAKAPVVKKDIIEMKIDETQEIANAKKGTGDGTWFISFGASQNNSQGVKNTLEPRLDRDDQVIMHDTFNKPLFLNSAIQLAVPGRTEKVIGKPYKTELTWILSELP
ncbi:WxL domain-containing protein [uncultured Enterococcus sp.]|uniref:WxL domain-containing protein n=1 Tax=uncultured Enterococcus sp. TaxID=167972 RepID=UPI002805D43F|nr:WxL domain-containing protein [uncultured Enterococcus sp.]